MVGCHRHAPSALPPRKSPGTHCTGGWVDPRSRLNDFQWGHVNVSFWANYIRYSLLANSDTNILTAHLRQPVQERSESNRRSTSMTESHHCAADYNAGKCVTQTCAYDYYNAPFVWPSVHLKAKNADVATLWKKICSNKIFTFLKYVSSHRFLTILSVTHCKFVYLARLGNTCTDTSIFLILTYKKLF
jgi:hypothetical protein